MSWKIEANKTLILTFLLNQSKERWKYVAKVFTVNETNFNLFITIIFFVVNTSFICVHLMKKKSKCNIYTILFDFTEFTQSTNIQISIKYA
jgi:hypothetical protein